MKILVAGGAGFIGSHLVDALIKEGHEITCVDDLSLGREENIAQHAGNPNFRFIKLDILDRAGLENVFRENAIEAVFHMAANSDIQKGDTEPRIDLEKTFLTTFSILECMKARGVKNIVFASSSAIYGELGGDLKETAGPLLPISSYGAAKLASEAYLAYGAHSFPVRVWITRFPNVVGSRATHGVVHDFILRLKKDPTTLTILGDGRQEKPYLDVRDLVRAILMVWKNTHKPVNVFNIGVESTTSVSEIARIVTSEMGLENVEFRYTGGDRGWRGDVPRFRYDLSKIHALGWHASMTSDEAVRSAARALLDRSGML